MKIRYLLLMLCILLVGCSAENSSEDEVMPFIKMDKRELSVPAVKLFFYSKEKNIMENSNVGSNFWNNIVDNENRVTYAKYEKEVIFYEQLMNMMALANLYEKDYELSENELQNARNNASRFYNEMNESDKNALDLSRDDVESIFITARQAQLMEQIYIDGWIGTISEEEYRVCLVEKNIFSSQTEADNYILSFVDTNVSYIRESFTVLSVSKDTDMNYQQLVDIFKLKNGESTKVYSTEEGYVVYTMINIFDNDLSEQKKKELTDEKQKSSWLQVCVKYLETAKVEYNQEEWNALNFSASDEYSMELGNLFSYIK